jgi:DNA-binding CsgD family transcriptional regulator
MSEEISYDFAISEYKRLWAELSKNQDLSTAFDKSSIDNSHIGLLSKSSQIVVSVFQNKTQKAEYISPNVKEMFGYDETHDSILGMLHYIKLIAWEHLTYPIQAVLVHTKIMKSIPKEEKKEVSIIYNGLKIKNKQGKILRLFVQTVPIEIDEENNPVRTLSLCQDVAPYLKDNFWWIRYTYGSKPQKVKYYHSQIGKYFDHDILSEREKEILKLIEKGFDSKEIAEKLFLSPATVNTHRKNMIDRMGVIDTTALIQLARLCAMI